MPIQAVIFDMDGVLVASEDYWLAARREFATERGLDWADDDHKACMGVATVEWAHVMKERLSLDTLSLDDIMADVIGRIIAKYDEHLPVLPMAAESVKLSATQYRVALASGSPTRAIKEVTALMGIDTVFEVMVFGDDIPRGKPAPDIYLETARLLNLDPADCVGIEDSANGVRALKAAGMFAIAVPSPGFPLSAEIMALADINLTSLTEFSLELVQNLKP
jgi:HAD superfamily hydrolase (TIGR01509 family)